MMHRPLPFVSCVLFVTACASLQAQTALSDYLAKRGWDPAKSGPMVVLEPDSVRSKLPASSLSDFSRELTHAGALAVIAPSEMTLVDDSFSQQPDLYEGMDRDAKIHYLMTLLNDQQWKQITTDGVSANDLRGEAKAVMRSLLPKPLKWNEVRVDERNVGATKLDSGTVPERQMDEVRLKFSRGLALQVHLLNPPNSISMFNTNMYPGQPGDVVYELAWEDRGIEHNPYGIHALQIVPNKSKPSQLPYSSSNLDGTVPLPESETIGEALESVQKVCNFELHADLRVANRTLRFKGASCRAGDLLQGIALTVTGTYRKIGPAYELTSDLVGIGARKVEFTVWEAEIAKEIGRRNREWNLAIGRSGHIRDIKFSSDSPYLPNEALKAEIAKNETQMTGAMVSTDTMPPAVRQYLQHMNAIYTTQGVDATQASVAANLEYGFVLPSGQALSPTGDLGWPASYQEYPNRPANRPELPRPPYALAGSASPNRTAIIQASDSDSLRSFVGLLHGYGFNDLWLETMQPGVLRAAIGLAKSNGMKVRLVLRPWALPLDFRADDEDATILGDHGDRLAARELNIGIWKDWDPYDTALAGASSRSISPAAGASPSRLARLAELAHVAGLSGIVLDDLQPFGYEGKRAEGYSSDLDKPLGELTNLGYSVNQRLAFLRANSLDPIDTMGERLMFRTDVRQPFFPDNATQWADDFDNPNEQLAALAREWDETRAAYYAKASEALLESLPTNLPDGILTSPVRKGINERGINGLYFRPLGQAPENASVIRDEVGLYRFPPNGKEDPDLPFNVKLAFLVKRAFSLALDFREVKASDLAAVLSKDFLPAQAKAGGP